MSLEKEKGFGGGGGIGRRFGRAVRRAGRAVRGFVRRITGR